jgi:hypothetical protein
MWTERYLVLDDPEAVSAGTTTLTVASVRLAYFNPTQPTFTPFTTPPLGSGP